jgi:hypothetical protein
VKKIGRTQFEVRYKDYSPDRNLQAPILYGPGENVAGVICLKWL